MSHRKSFIGLKSSYLPYVSNVNRRLLVKNNPSYQLVALTKVSYSLRKNATAGCSTLIIPCPGETTRTSISLSFFSPLDLPLREILINELQIIWLGRHY